MIVYIIILMKLLPWQNSQEGYESNWSKQNQIPYI